MLMRIFTTACLGFLLSISRPQVASAVGTPAGTSIHSSVTLTYSIGGRAPSAITSPPVTFIVDQVVDLTMTWQDGAPVSVTSPGANGVLTFVITNIGNGPEFIALARNNAVTGDNYDPQNGTAGAIFLENGQQPGFQATGSFADSAYTGAGSNPLLPANASLTVYVLSNTPASLANGTAGMVALTATSTMAGAAGSSPGTTLTGKGVGGIDAVVGNTRAQAAQTGTYRVGGVQVSVAKTVVGSLDPRGGSSFVSGSVVTYQIIVRAAGQGIAQGLSVNDPIPADMTYVANSISVDGAARSDLGDADNVSFQNGAVLAQFGDASAPTSHIIQFRVTIN
jgi:uncharacterized repeat protein (TIGR01451 family)